MPVLAALLLHPAAQLVLLRSLATAARAACCAGGRLAGCPQAHRPCRTPRGPQAHEGEKQKHLKAAQQALAGAAAARGDDPAVWTTTAVCSAALGRPEDALSALHRALKLQVSAEQAEQLAHVVPSCARHLLRKEQHRQLGGCVQAAAAVAAQLPAAGQGRLKEQLGAALQGAGDAAEVQEARAAVEALP